MAASAAHFSKPKNLSWEEFWATQEEVEIIRQRREKAGIIYLLRNRTDHRHALDFSCPARSKEISLQIAHEIQPMKLW